jgi:hypothetical protein
MAKDQEEFNKEWESVSVILNENDVHNIGGLAVFIRLTVLSINIFTFQSFQYKKAYWVY